MATVVAIVVTAIAGLVACVYCQEIGRSRGYDAGYKAANGVWQSLMVSKGLAEWRVFDKSDGRTRWHWKDDSPAQGATHETP